MHGIVPYKFFYTWLLSLNIMSVRSSHTAALTAVNSFLFFYNISIEGIYSNLFFILILIDSELSPVWVTAKITTLNTDMSPAQTFGAYLHSGRWTGPGVALL